MTGKEKSSGNDLVITFAGSELNKNYFTSLAFQDSYTEKHLGVKWIWQLPDNKGNLDHTGAMFIREIPAGIGFLFRNKREFQIPNLVNMEIDIPDNIASFVDCRSAYSSVLKNKSFRTDLTRIKKNNLTFEIADELSQLNEFFNNMYVPYTKKVHDDRAILLTFNWILKEYRNWEVLFVKKGDQRLGGILLNYRKNRGYLRLLGIEDANLRSLQEGVTGALYYYSFCHLREKGYKVAVMGGTRPFLKDGVLIYKKRRGARVAGKFDKRFILRIPALTPGVIGFLKNNPFIYIEGSKLNGAVFDIDDSESEKTDFSTISKNYFIKGLAGMYLYPITDAGLSLKRIIPEETPG